MLEALLARPLQPAALVDVTIGGKTFRCSRRTAAHLLWTIALLAVRYPGARLVVIQGCYNTGVAASAFTHDYDAVLDVQIIGLDWWAAQRVLRECGWAAWYRHTGTWAAASRWHIHMASLGAPGKVGKFIDGGLSLFGRIVGSSQIDDYYHHALGLAGQHNSGGDSSWFPADIASTIFDYPAWVADQEDNMPYNDWPKADRDAIAKDVATAVTTQLLATVVDTGLTVKQALKQAANAPGLVRGLAKAFGKKV